MRSFSAAAASSWCPARCKPRDVGTVVDVRRYKFPTPPQLRELWWPSSSVQAADRRLLKIFRVAYLDHFRPLSRHGSFPWLTGLSYRTPAEVAQTWHDARGAYKPRAA